MPNTTILEIFVSKLLRVYNFCVRIFSWIVAITHKIKHTKCLLYINIRAFNFRGSLAPRKYLNNENFQNYGTVYPSKLLSLYLVSNCNMCIQTHTVITTHVCTYLKQLLHELIIVQEWSSQLNNATQILAEGQLSIAHLYSRDI